MRVLSAFLIFVFSCNQIVFAVDANSYQEYRVQPIQSVTDADSVELNPAPSQTIPNTTTDFLLNADSPLSPTFQASPQNDPNKTFDPDGKLRTEITLDGHTIRHVYAEESIQTVIDSAVSGDTVYLHAGTYHAHLVLKDGVDLEGEDTETTVLTGDFQSGNHVIRALGNNQIEGLTITGGGPYSGMPSSAVRVEGDNVKIRNNQIINNQDYGIHIVTGQNTLIEMNFFKDTHLGVQLPNDTAVIRYNTFIHNDIAVNVLNGAKPRIENNIFTGSTFQSIYEFSWSAYASGQASRGFAIVENNTFFNNTERGSYYGSATPPAAETQTAGNQHMDPGFVDPAHGNYSILTASAAYGRGCYLPVGLKNALDRSSRIPASSTLRNILDGTNIIGYEVIYAEGSREQFYNDGRQGLDIVPPVLAILSTIVLTNQAAYTLRYTVEGIEHIETRTLVEGANTLMVEAADIFGNKATASFAATLDRTAPAGGVRLNSGNAYTNAGVFRIEMKGEDALSGLGDFRISLDGGATWEVWQDLEIRARTIYVSRSFPDGIERFSYDMENWHGWDETDELAYRYAIDMTLALGELTDGEYSFSVQFRDKAGNVSGLYQDTIIYDGTLPQGSIGLRDYPSNNYFYDFPLTLSLTATDSLSGVQKMRFSLDGGTQWTDWENYSAERRISLDEAKTLYDYYGTNTVRFMTEFKDQAGNVRRESFSSTRDGEFPQGTVSINGGAAYTNSREVTLDLTAHDSISGVRGMQIRILNSDHSIYSDTGLISFSTTQTVTLPEGDGQKDVQYWVCDWAACRSFSDSIILDTVAPAVVVTSSLPSLTNQASLVVNYTVDGAVKQKIFTLAEGDNAALTITEVDLAGNARTITLSNVKLDTKAPELGLLSDAYVYSSSYTLRYRISDSSMTTTTQQENVTLNRGWNTFTRQATDSLGHVREMTWRIYLDLNAERGQNFDYDTNGNVVRTTNFNGEDTLYAYDALNRLKLVTFPDGSNVKYRYDTAGNLGEMEDSRGITHYYYDIANRLSSIAFPDGKTIHYDLDNAGQLIGLRYAGRSIAYAYDVAGRLISVTEGGGGTTYAYNNAGDLTSTTLPNGIRTTNTYDTTGRLTDILHENISGAVAELVARFHYTLDLTGQKTQMIEIRPEGTRTVDYTYDEFGRLTQDIDSAYGTTHYTYDAAGNRLSMERIPVAVSTSNPRIVNQYTYGIDNRLVSMAEIKYDAGNVQLSSMTETYVYDAAGRMLQKITPDQVTYYEYDARGLLARVNDGENETTYEYDGLGNRIAKTVNGERTEYMVNIAQAIPQVLAEMDNVGVVTRSYKYGMGRLSQTDGTENQYFLSDALGSTIGLTTQAGATETTYQYSAFGNSLAAQTATAATPFLYAGEQLDLETGFMYLRARYYDPSMGRFISRDPQSIGELFQTQSFNPFIYVQNNPVNFVDPSGLIGQDLEYRVWDSYSGEIRDPNRSYEAMMGLVNAVNGPPLIMTAIAAAPSSLSALVSAMPYAANFILAHPQLTLAIASAAIKSLGNTESFTDFGTAFLISFFDSAVNGWANLSVVMPAGSPGVHRTYSNWLQNYYSNSDDAEVSNNNNNSGTLPPGGGGSIGGSLPGSANTGGNSGSFLGNLFSGIGSAIGSVFSGITGAVSSVLGGIASLFRGGVYMNKALDVVGVNINNVRGVTYDSRTGQIILLSETGANIPEIPVDYFLAALKAVFGQSQAVPGVSIDPPKDANGNYITDSPIHDVNFFGGVENTQLGKAIYDADYLMKKISDDKVEAAFIQAHIPGFKTLSALIEDSLRAQIENKNFNSEDEVRQIILNKQNSASHRMWFTPKQMDLIRSQDGSAFVFGDHSVELKSEAVFLSGQSAGSCPEAEAFTGFFNAHFSEFAELYPELKELEKAMRAVGLARFIADNNVPVDLNWLATASLPAVSTPTTTPSIRVDSSISIPFYINGQAGTTIATLNYSMQGGVDYNLVLGNNLSYSNDNGETAALGLSTQNSRPNDLTTAWNIQWGDSTLQATALSLAPTQKEGSFSWQDTDLSYGTTGDFGLSFQRYYDSFLATDKTALGYGWANVPYELDFPVANASKTFSDGAGGSVVVSIPPKILFTDWANHQLLEFTPHQRQGDGHIIYAPKDNKITRELFVLNPDGSYIYRRDGQEIFFNAAGILQSLKDRNGNQISYIYDIQGKLARIKDVTSAREITLTYDGLGRVSTVLGPDGRSVQYVYDAATGNLKTVTCGWTGRTTTFEYNADHQLTKAIDYAGRVMFVNAFDGIGRLTSQTNFLGNQTQLSSNLLSQGTAVTSSATGTQGGWQYNSNFQLITGTDALGNQVHYTYGDNLFGPVSATDSFGNTTYYAYDEFGNVKEMTDVFGNKTKYYYNRVAGDNRPLFIEKTNGRGTAYSYDVHGNLSDVYEGARISNIAGDGTITIEYTNVHTHMEYDAQGRLIAQTDPEGRTTHYEYDNAGHVTSITDGMGHQATTTYVQRNGVVTNLISQMTDAIGRSVQYVYDSVTDLLTSVTTSTGTIHYGYDSLDRLNLIRDENGHESELVYNDKNQLISTINRSASGHVEDNLRVNYSYDALGRLIAMTGPMGAATGFIYDLLSRIKRVVISEPVPSYGAVGSLSIENVKTDQADLAFTAGTGLSQVVVRYRANGEVNYRQIVIDHPVTGDNKLTLQGLTEKTKYEVELELKDNDGHTSYSRKYQFETKQTQPPVIDSLVARDIAEQNANIRLSVSKEISEISLAFHVLGETTTKVIRVEGLQSGSIDVDLEELRIGMTYSVDVIVKDAQGRQSLLKNVQFKMLGTPSSEETVNYREAEARYGAILGATGTMALLSIENPNVSNPGAEHYLVTLSDDQGHTPPPGAYIAGIYQSSTFGMYLYLAGLTPNTHYNYMLTNVNRLDILAVGGEFRTGDPADTIWPATSGGGYRNRDSQSLVFYRRLTEDLSTMKITLTDQATQGQKTYWFFHVPGEQYTEFLLDGLSAGHSYAASWTIVDMSGHVSSGYSTDIMVVEEAKDEIPPQVVERVVTQKTATMAALHVTTNELLRKLKVQYRVTGTEEWFEQNVVRTDNAFDVVLENLQAGASYQYRYVLEDMDGNQLVAAWENLALQNLAAGPMAAALKTNLAVLNATETSTNGMFINGQEIHNISSVDLALVSFEADASFELKMDNGKTPAAGKDPGSFVGTSKYRLSNTAFQFASAPVTSPVSSADLLAESPAFLAKPRDLSGVVMEAEVGQKTQKMHNRKKGHAAAKLYNVDRVGGLNLTNKMSLLGKDLTAALLSDDITGERYGRWLDGK